MITQIILKTRQMTKIYKPLDREYLEQQICKIGRLPSKGKGYNIFNNPKLYDKIRERLSLTKKEFPDVLIKKVMKFTNEELMNYLFDNPEGMVLQLSEKRIHGCFAISKHMPKEMRDNKFDKVEDIENNPNIAPWLKKVFLKRYSTDITRRKDLHKIKSGEVAIHLNLNTFMYTYKIIWFNKRNCNIKKSLSYIFEPGYKFKLKLYEQVTAGKDFYEYNFDDFYKFKVKPIQ